MIIGLLWIYLLLMWLLVCLLLLELLSNTYNYWFIICLFVVDVIIDLFAIIRNFIKYMWL